jgi:hypothetical protein
VSRGPAAFKPRDLASALRAMTTAGIEVRSIELDPITGKIIIMTVASCAKEPATDLDKWLAEHGTH